MSEPASAPATAAVHDLAVRNFEKYMRFARISGFVLLPISIVIFAIPFVLTGDHYDIWLSWWYFTIRQMACSMVILLLGQAYLYPRLSPVYRKPVNMSDAKEYRNFLYAWGRPLKDSMREGLRAGLIISLPLAVGGLVWLLLPRLWPDYPKALVGILILLGFGAFIISVIYMRHQLEREIDMWYAAHFPANDQL